MPIKVHNAHLVKCSYACLKSFLSCINKLKLTKASF